MSQDDQRDLATDPKPQPPGPDAGPGTPLALGRGPLWKAAKCTVKEFTADNITDWAAALTYYGVLSIFPGLLVLVSLVGLLGDDTVDAMVANISEMAPGDARQILTDAVNNLQNSSTAGLMAIVGLIGAFWAASGYVGAFMRAANAVYDVPEGRPIWKTIPIRMGVTAVIGVLLVLSATIVVFTGPLAERVGEALGLGSAVVTTWDLLKWPVLVLLVSGIVAILYRASPNARQGGFHWVSPGSVLAVLVWIIASVGFSFYVANFGSYNKTYGAVASVIIFLVWLWISNLAILLGAEFDAELERQRAVHAGYEDGKEPFLQLRDDRNVKEGADQGLR